MNIGSSHGETKQSLTYEPRLIDVIAALEKRNRQDEADYYKTIYPFFVSLIYGLSEEEVMLMTVDEISELTILPQKPQKYEGWDTFFFGRVAFNGNG